MPEQEWFYAAGNETAPQGPVPAETLRQMIGGGQLPLDTRVWTEGMGAWETAAMRPELSTIALGTVGMGSAPVVGAGAAVQALSYQSQSFDAPKYAGFWMRFVAYIIDVIVTTFVGFLIGLALGLLVALATYGSQNSAGNLRVTTGVAQLFGYIGGWLYYALMESSRFQGTLGKMALGLVVTDEQGGRIGFGRATGRHFAKILSLLIFAVGYMMVGWTQKKQGLHDIVAGTLMIRRR